MRRSVFAPAPEPVASSIRPRRWRRASPVLAVALFAALPVAAPAQVVPEKDKLEAVQRAIAKERERAGLLDSRSERAAAEAADLSRALVAIARESQALERKTAQLQGRVAELTRARDEKAARLKNERARLTDLLAALQRIARHPPEALLAYTATPTDTLRGAMLLKSVIPRIEARANVLRSDLESLARLGEDAAQRKAALIAATAQLARKREETARLLERKKSLVRTTEAERKEAARRAKSLRAQAFDLRGLIKGIERERRSRKVPAAAAPGPQVKARPTPPGAGLGEIPPFSAARGRLTAPVVGRIVARFGVKGNAGLRNQGIRFTAAPGAQVVAPHDGHVVFAGPFRGYGRLLIIDHGEGYHTLLAGLGRIDAALNQRLLAGEPIGIMARTGTEDPRLYLELRRNGRPVDPLPWLAAKSTDKESG